MVHACMLWFLLKNIFASSVTCPALAVRVSCVAGRREQPVAIETSHGGLTGPEGQTKNNHTVN